MVTDQSSVTIGQLLTLQRGSSYQSRLLDLPGPVLLGLASIHRDGGFRDDSLRTYGGDCPEKMLLRPGDLYVSLKDVTQSGDLLGSISRVPQSVALGRLTQDTVKLVFHNDGFDRCFFYWSLRAPEFRAYCRERAMGTTNLSLSREDFLSYPLPIPSPSQRQLAHTLDDLEARLELNRRTNQTLEALAATIFKAWFMDFEPVKAKAAGAKSFPSMPQPVFDTLPSSFVPAPKSPSGEIPKGWTIGSLGEVVEQIRDAIEPGEVSPELRYIGLEHMPRGSICLDQNGAPEDVSSLKMRFSKGDILFGKLRPYFKKVGIPGFAGICSSDIIVARPKGKRDLAFAIGHLSSQEFIDHCDRCSNGAKMPRVNWSDMARYEVVVAPETVMAAATELFSPLIQQIHANIEESATLAAMRDLLLPKLLSGEVRVATAAAVNSEGHLGGVR
jgi:type I restriction enzyme S subunit